MSEKLSTDLKNPENFINQGGNIQITKSAKKIIALNA